jgi:hypothetical protein
VAMALTSGSRSTGSDMDGCVGKLSSAAMAGFGCFPGRNENTGADGCGAPQISPGVLNGGNDYEGAVLEGVAMSIIHI